MKIWKHCAPFWRVCAGVVLLALAACGPNIGSHNDGVYAPGVNRLATDEDGVTVGHRLISAQEYELALRAFSRAALERGETDAEILLGMGTANLGLGRLNQAERLLRVAAEKEEDWPEIYNNLGVVLMEQGREREAAQIFRRAYALDSGESDDVRDNLRLALSNSAQTAYDPDQKNEYKLVRRGASDYLIEKTP